MWFDSYAILLGSQASLKSYNYCVDHRSKNYLKRGQTTPKDCFRRSK